MLQIETSTGRHWEVVVKGHAVDLQIDCTRLDGREWRPGEFDLGVNFGDGCVGGTICRNLTIYNRCEVHVRYYWRISRQMEISLSGKVMQEQEKDTDTKEVCWEAEREFVADPIFGFFPALVETNISLKFTPPNMIKYMSIARLYVDTRMDLPLASSEWKKFRDQLFRLENEIHKESNGRQQYRFTNEEYAVNQVDNMGKISKLFEVNMLGVGVHLDVSILPNLLVVSGGLTLGTVRNFKIVLRNNSPCNVHFSWERPRTPSKSVLPCHKNGVYFQPLTGVIVAHGNQDVLVILKARTIGAIEAKHMCHFTNPTGQGESSLLLQVEGHVRGPVVALSPAMLNYGLVQVKNITYGNLL